MKHTITIDLNNHIFQKDAKESQKKINQILLVKSEPDIQYLYYSLITDVVFRKLGVEIVEK
jgi:hypothetical protein